MGVNINNISRATKIGFNAIDAKIAPFTKRKYEEFEEQKNFVKWLNLKKIPHFAIPNGGARNVKEASNLKSLGVRAGVSDIFIMVPNKYHSGLFIKMKKQSGGKVSKTQELFIEQAIELGYCASGCNGGDEARKLTEKYLKTARNYY